MRNREKLGTGWLVGGALLLLFAFVVVLQLASPASQARAEAEPDGKVYSDLYVCSMHPEIASDGPDRCTRCGMALSDLQGHKAGDPHPGVDRIYAMANSPMKLRVGAQTGFMPITESPYYQPPSSQGAGQSEGCACCAGRDDEKKTTKTTPTEHSGMEH